MSAIKSHFALALFLLALSFVGLAQLTDSDDPTSRDNFDVDALVDRISHSKFLGFLTKISLKRDIDQLLESIRHYHDGTGDNSLEQLRERYDVMVHKLVIRRYYFLAKRKTAKVRSSGLQG